MPNVTQLRSVLASATDDIDQRLILNLQGDFQFVPFKDANDSEIFSQLDYVTRWETLDAGNGWVGTAAAQYNDFINKIMDWAQEVWNRYHQGHPIPIVNLHS